MTDGRDPGETPTLRLGVAPGLDLVRPRNPRFAQQPFAIRDFRAWRGRDTGPNANAGKQAAAKRARKAARGSR